MVVKSRKKKPYKKRPYRKIVRYKKPAFSGLGNKHVARLRYCQEISINPGVAGIASTNFRANDLYDPDSTGVGHQPFGFDQLMAYYDHFTVTGSKITARFVPVSGTNVNPAYLGIMLSDSGTRVNTVTSVEHLLESKYSQGYCLAGGYITANMGFNRQKNYTTKKFSAKGFFGCQDVIGDSQYKGSSSASPTELAYYEVWAASLYGNDPGAITCLVTIDFIATFTEPKLLSQS